MASEMSRLTAVELRASADQLRAVLEAADEGMVEATGRERAFISGALWAVEDLREQGGCRFEKSDIPN